MFIIAQAGNFSHSEPAAIFTWQIDPSIPAFKTERLYNQIDDMVHQSERRWPDFVCYPLVN
jgi:hypothetical protein